MRSISRLSLVLFSSLALPAFAQSGPRMSAYFYPEDDDAAPLAAEADRVFRVEFAKSTLVSYVDVNRLLEGEQPPALLALEDAQKKYAEGKELLAALKPEKALPLLDDAFRIYVGSLSYAPDNQELTEICLDLAKASFLSKARKKSVTPEVALRRALLLTPSLSFDPARLSPRMKETFEAAQKDIENAPRGTFRVESSPSFAEVYIDGKYVGVTPLDVPDLTVGEHFLSVRKNGYEKYTSLIEVSADKTGSILASLVDLPRGKLLVDAVTSARVDAGTTTAANSILEFRGLFQLDQVILGSTETLEENKIRVTAYLYDLRSKARLNRVQIDIDPTLPGREDTLISFARSIFEGVDLSGFLAAPDDAIKPPDTRDKPSIFSRKGFYISVGGIFLVAAGVITAVTFEPRFRCGANQGSCVGIDIP